MFAQPTKKHMKGLVPVAIALTLAGVFVAAMAFARITANTIDPVATITDNGRRLRVTGPIQCTVNERVELRVTVTQRSTGAVAEGTTRFTCTGDLQHWKVRASIQGHETFEEGPATAVALALTTDHGKTTDALQWLVNIALANDDDDDDPDKALTEAVDEETFPAGYALSQNFPNPFNRSTERSRRSPETEIRFQLPSASHVVVRIFNRLGQEIRTLTDAQYEVGDHIIRWDGKDNHGNTVASGIYFYGMQAGEFSQMKKMSLLR